MKTISKNSRLPLYLQLVQEIKNKISINNLRPGDKIESEEVLVRKYSISRVTVRKALQYLCDEGILVKKQGKGTYVSAPTLIEDVMLSESFSGYCSLSGKKTTTRVIQNQKRIADACIALQLGVEEGDEIIELRRIRLIEGIPAIFEIDYFRKSDQYILYADFTSISLLAEVINNSSLDIHSFSDELIVEDASEKISQLMRVDNTYRFLVVNQTVLSASNDIVYFNKQYINTDVYRYKIKSVRGGK